MFESRRSTGSSQSLLRTLSARLDSASGMISALLLLGALLGTVLATLLIVKPNIERKRDLTKRLKTKHESVEALKLECAHTLDRIEAYRDPYYIAKFAQERYNFKPAPASTAGG